MDRADFASALQPHYNDALRYCRALVARSSHTEAEDVLQEALLKALRHYDQLKEPAKFKAWLFQIITRTYHSAARKTIWKRLLPLDTSAVHIPPVYQDVDRIDAQGMILDALAQLPGRQRAAFLLFELSGFSLEEIRVIQGDRSLSAVKSRLSRTRKQLKGYLLEMETNPRRTRAPSTLHDLHHETLQTTRQGLDALGRR